MQITEENINEYFYLIKELEDGFKTILRVKIEKVIYEYSQETFECPISFRTKTETIKKTKAYVVDNKNNKYLVDSYILFNRKDEVFKEFEKYF